MMSDSDLTTQTPATTTRGERTRKSESNNPKTMDLNSTLRADIAQSTKILKAKLTGVKDSMRATSASTAQTLQNGVSDLQAQIAGLQGELRDLRAVIVPADTHCACHCNREHTATAHGHDDDAPKPIPGKDQLQEIMNAQDDLRRDMRHLQDEFASFKTSVQTLTGLLVSLTESMAQVPSPPHAGKQASNNPREDDIDLKPT